MFAQALRHTPRHRVKRRAKELSSIERWNERIKMKSHVKYLCLAMALCLALGFASVANASLPDVGDHWAKAGIEKWVDSGLAKGYPDGTFKPDNNITRAEFVALMNRAFDVPKDGAAISFADVKAADWYYADVCAAANGGYVKGYEDNTFRPNNAITRAEAAAIVARLLELPAGDLGALDKFSDAASIADWAKGSVAAMVEANLLSGYPDGTFGPAKLITRAESVVTLDRAADYAGIEIEIPVIVDVSVEGVSLNLTSLSLKVGDSSQLKATVKPENASVKTVSWESSNDKVATVDSNGKVIAVATGSATITVTTKDGAKTASCSVAVTQYSSSGGGGGSTPAQYTIKASDVSAKAGAVAGLIAIKVDFPSGVSNVKITKVDGLNIDPAAELTNGQYKSVPGTYKTSGNVITFSFDANGVTKSVTITTGTAGPEPEATIKASDVAAKAGAVAGLVAIKVDFPTGVTNVKITNVDGLNIDPPAELTSGQYKSVPGTYKASGNAVAFSFETNGVTKNITINTGSGGEPQPDGTIAAADVSTKAGAVAGLVAVKVVFPTGVTNVKITKVDGLNIDPAAELIDGQYKSVPGTYKASGNAITFSFVTNGVTKSVTITAGGGEPQPEATITAADVFTKAGAVSGLVAVKVVFPAGVTNVKIAKVDSLDISPAAELTNGQYKSVAGSFKPGENQITFSFEANGVVKTVTLAV